ncbi:hypothetical protein GGU11DRAFT_154959 [Lentinula aff. detonsa]|nr:hypothetical protein GGU11DRAFT_154959 [Lentinula aff. detonsa]
MLDRLRYLKDLRRYCIRCMTEGCAIIAPDDFALIRFRELDVRGLVASKSKLRFCLYPGCRNTDSCPSAASKFVLGCVGSYRKSFIVGLVGVRCVLDPIRIRIRI